MAYTAEELGSKKVAELREIAKDVEHDALAGYSSMRKDELVEALMTALGGKASAPAASARKAPSKKKAEPAGPSKRRAAKRLATAGLNTAGIKSLISSLKSDRAEALSAGDHDRLRIIRRQLHHLKRRSRQTSAVERAAAAVEAAAAAAKEAAAAAKAAAAPPPPAEPEASEASA